MKLKIYSSSIYWSYPTNRPAGYPKVLAYQVIQSFDNRVVTKFPKIENLMKTHKSSLPRGYCVGWSALNPPPALRSDEFRAAARLRGLKKRLLKRVPLFFDEFFEREIEENSEYYTGTLDANTLKFRAEIQVEYEKSKELAKTNALVVEFEWWKHKL